MKSTRARVLRATVAVALTAALLEGCIFLPQTSTEYDRDCDIYERKMTLEAHQVASLANCSNESCAALLVVVGAVSAATAVVSGSVVVVGNAVYWLEKKGQCLTRNDKPG